MEGLNVNLVGMRYMVGPCVLDFWSYFSHCSSWSLLPLHLIVALALTILACLPFWFWFLVIFVPRGFGLIFYM